MTKFQEGALNSIRSRPNCQRAVVFLHGFSGRPGRYLGSSTRSPWHGCCRLGMFFTLGYATTFRPDLLGVWSADPDLPILAIMLKTQAGIDPLRRYSSLALGGP